MHTRAHMCTNTPALAHAYMFPLAPAKRLYAPCSTPSAPCARAPAACAHACSRPLAVEYMYRAQAPSARARPHPSARPRRQHAGAHLPPTHAQGPRTPAHAHPRARPRWAGALHDAPARPRRRTRLHRQRTWHAAPGTAVGPTTGRRRPPHGRRGGGRRPPSPSRAPPAHGQLGQVRGNGRRGARRPRAHSKIGQVTPPRRRPSANVLTSAAARPRPPLPAVPSLSPPSCPLARRRRRRRRRKVYSKLTSEVG
jgi:hypothetical protein